VALLTTDSYRIAAYEQLKIYGKILGVAVHAVKDTDDLRLTLSALRHKHLVLIDTVGMGQRDERVGDQNEMFEATGVKCLLMLNATSSGDTLEDVVRMYRSSRFWVASRPSWMRRQIWVQCWMWRCAIVW